MKSIVIYTFILAFFLIACEEEDVLLELESQIVVEAFLHADQALDSIQLFKVSAYTSDEPVETVDNAPVQIKINDETFDLVSNGSEGIYSLSNHIIEAGDTYQISMEFEDQIVSAETIIPAKPDSLSLSSNEISLTKITDFTDIQNASFPDPVEITWELEGNQYYFVLIENIEDNPERVNELFEVEDNENVRISSTPDNINNYFLDTRRAISQYGTYRIILFSVNAEYAALFENLGDESTSLSEPSTNVINGKGIFTGINSDTTYLEVKKL